MGNKQIDILFEEYKNDNLEYLWYCANIQGEFSREKVGEMWYSLIGD